VKQQIEDSRLETELKIYRAVKTERVKWEAREERLFQSKSLEKQVHMCGG
jgi:hypothetical protein